MILLGQKGVRQFLGSFFLIWEFFLKFPSFPAIQGHQRSFRSDPNVDGLLQRAGVNYKWPVELGKCSKGSRGHPEANFFRRISCWPFSSLCLFFCGRNVSLFNLENPGTAQMQNWIFRVYIVWDWWWRQQKNSTGRSVDAFASAFSMALATRERIVSSATWNTKNPSWSWTRCEEKFPGNFFGAVFLSWREGSTDEILEIFV